jgi:flagellar motor switch/type III secretory pathway protein FliN
MLEADELAALRVAMGQTAQKREESPDSPVVAQRIALIAEDRAAALARPAAIRLSTRWTRTAKRLIARMCRAQIEFDMHSAEAVEAASLRDMLGGGWNRVGGILGRPGAILLLASGSMIETLAARLLGAGGPEDETQAHDDRPPSQLALRLFDPVGETLAMSLVEAWQDEQGHSPTFVADPAKVHAARGELTGTGIVLMLTLDISGGARGQLRLVMRPELLGRTAEREPTVVSPPGVEEALGAVPVEVAVELGRCTLTMNELAALRPGAIVTLDRFIDDLLPVKVQGVVKAYGRAMVARSAMAVEIAPVRAQSEAA